MNHSLMYCKKPRHALSYEHVPYKGGGDAVSCRKVRVNNYYVIMKLTCGNEKMPACVCRHLLLLNVCCRCLLLRDAESR